VAEVQTTRIVLVGFMGAGKTTVGPLVAAILGWDFIDMDQAIEQRMGRTVASIFKELGEERFRQEERAVAEELQARSRLVVAAGGGAFTREDTRNLLKTDGIAVWLRCDLATILARVPEDGSRPLAANHAIMKNLLADRESSYRLADVAVDSGGAAAPEVARRVVEEVRKRVPLTLGAAQR
jgi:shikimate kinase